MSSNDDGTVKSSDAQAREGSTPARIEAPDYLLEFMLAAGLTDWTLDDGRVVSVMAIEKRRNVRAPELLDGDSLADHARKLSEGGT